MNDLTGCRFGKWTVLRRGEDRIHYPPSRPHGHRKSTWICRCECGTEQEILTARLLNAQCCQKCSWMKPTHGRTGTSEFKAWDSMKQRCTNPNAQQWPNYGACGIKVCDRWLDSFENFLSDIGPKPSPGMVLDRIDNNGNYEPNNVRWTTAKISSRNHRANHHLTLNGVTATIAEWCEKLGVSQRMVRCRLARGWSDEAALTEPYRYCGNKRGKNSINEPSLST